MSSSLGTSNYKVIMVPRLGLTIATALSLPFRDNFHSKKKKTG